MKYLLFAVGAIVFILIGILMNIQINNWNEERKVAADDYSKTESSQTGLTESMQMEGKMPVAKVLSAVEIEDSVQGKPAMVSTVEVTIEPNEASIPHRHPGAVYGYVLEGTYEFKIEGQPKRVLEVGDTFYEPRMILHQVSRNPSDQSKTRILAVIVHPRDAKQLMIPEPPKKTSE